MKEANGKFIILKTLKYGEADLIVQALNSQGSKQSFIAKKALRSKKRFGGGVLEPLHFVHLFYKESTHGHKMSILQEGHLLKDFPLLRQDYDTLEQALHFLDCIHQLAQEGDHHSESLFNLLGNALTALNTSQKTLHELQILRMHFYLKILHQQGVLPFEKWMEIFLKTTLKDSATLLPLKINHSESLIRIEKQVLSYLKTASFNP